MIRNNQELTISKMALLCCVCIYSFMIWFHHTNDLTQVNVIAKCIKRGMEHNENF